MATDTAYSIGMALISNQREIAKGYDAAISEYESLVRELVDLLVAERQKNAELASDRDTLLADSIVIDGENDAAEATIRSLKEQIAALREAHTITTIRLCVESAESAAHRATADLLREEHQDSRLLKSDPEARTLGGEPADHLFAEFHRVYASRLKEAGVTGEHLDKLREKGIQFVEVEDREIGAEFIPAGQEASLAPAMVP